MKQKSLWILILIFGIMISAGLLYLYNFIPYFTATKNRVVASLLFILFYEGVVWSMIRSKLEPYARQRGYLKDIYITSGVILFLVIPLMLLVTLVLIVLGYE
jgi:hypothetical protein